MYKCFLRNLSLALPACTISFYPSLNAFRYKVIVPEIKAQGLVFFIGENGRICARKRFQ